MQTKILIRNLALNTTEEDLRVALASCGEVLNAQIMTNNAYGRERGFALVEMATQVAAECVVRQLNMRELNGRQLDIKLADDSKGKSTAKRGRRR